MPVKPGWFDGLLDVRSLSQLTGLSQSTIRRFNSGQFTPSRRTMGTLDDVYRQLQMGRLLASGMTAKESSRFSTRSPEIVDRRRDEMERIIETMAKNYKTTTRAIRKKLDTSDKTFEQFQDSELISIQWADEHGEGDE